MTIIVGSNGEQFTWEENYGNEDFHERIDGDDITIPLIIQKTIADDEEYIRLEDADAGTSEPAFVVFGDGGIISNGNSWIDHYKCGGHYCHRRY